ncbi:MAG: protocatechuate 3,4-dioxygenase subunit alpha [Chloroflexota bacterium]
MLKQTPSQTVGPWFKFGLVFEGGNNLLTDETKGQRINIKGRVFDGDGAPIVDALVEIWQPDAQGIFNSPADPRHAEVDPHFHGFGRAETAPDNIYTFKTIKPGRIAWDDKQEQSPFINVRIFARGMLNFVITRLYFSDEQSNQTDPVLNLIQDTKRRQTLIAQLEPSNDLPTYYFDIVLQGDHETVFFEP